MNKDEWKRLGKNALIFLAPVALVELELLQKGATGSELLIAFKVWIIGVGIDFFRKLKQGN